MPCFPEKGSLKVWLSVITYQNNVTVSDCGYDQVQILLLCTTWIHQRVVKRIDHFICTSFHLIYSGFWSPHREKVDDLQNRSSFDRQTQRLFLKISGNILKSSWRMLQKRCYHGNQVSGATFFKICICFSKIGFNSIFCMELLYYT